jgi:hypothetical protein
MGGCLVDGVGFDEQKPGESGFALEQFENLRRLYPT